MKPTLAIGITALNENKNIHSLITSLLAQKESGFILQTILVVSDGSTDSTVSTVRSIPDPRIEIRDHAERAGKNARINEILESAQTDIVVLLDADILIPTSDLVSALIAPILNDSSISAVSGRAEPLPPKNFTQKVITAGWDMWDYLRSTTPHSDMYKSEGPIRAFRKSLYERMRFEEAISDDVYPYLYCKKYNYQFAFATDAIVYYTLPKTYRDFANQMVRFLRSEHIESLNFSPAFVKQFYVITTWQKFKALIRYVALNPMWTILYVVYLLIPKITLFLRKKETHSPTWTMAVTTKNLK